MSTEISYLVLIFALFVIPPMLVRLKVPAGITAFAMGTLFAATTNWFEGDAGLPLLANFGIIALFLLAGLEVELPKLKKEAKPLVSYIALRLLLLAGLAWAMNQWFGLQGPAAWIFSLALITPSTGFIMDSLDKQPLSGEEKGWVRTIAIAMELTALVILFFAMQSSSWLTLFSSLAAFVVMIMVLPIIFRFFARVIAPWAPHSEFAFLLMVALLAGYITRALGTYYLVGAFIVGITAQRFRTSLPRATSEVMLETLKVFAFFFLPFYFFKSGRTLAKVELSVEGIVIGILLLAVLVPLRLGMTWIQLKLVLRKSFMAHKNVAVALLPNLIFGIVLSEILLDKFGLIQPLYLALVIYTLGVSIVPAIMLGGAGIGLDPWGKDFDGMITLPRQDELDEHE